ncbi:Cullin repeat-like-containing domain protein [Cladochytrium replicatum]|nr:Cullin repeat-like-containing domain protein [Cladochytrium replicatum]
MASALIEENKSESSLISAAGKFYKAEGSKISSLSVADYVSHAHGLLKDAEDAAKSLSGPTRNKFIDVVIDELVESTQSTLVSDKGLILMMDQSQEKPLKHLYDLVSRTSSGPSAMLKAISSHVRRAAKEAKREEPDKWTEQILELKEQYDTLVQKVFDGDDRIGTEISNAFDKALTENTKFSDMIKRASFTWDLDLKGV